MISLDTCVDTTVVVRARDATRTTLGDKNTGAKFIARGYLEKTQLKRHVVRTSTACHRFIILMAA